MRTVTNIPLTSKGFLKFLDALPEGMKEEVWNDHDLDKHRENIKDKIAEGMYIWNDPNQDVSALRHDVKLYMVIIKHHTQSTKSGIQDMASAPLVDGSKVTRRQF